MGSEQGRHIALLLPSSSWWGSSSRSKKDYFSGVGFLGFCGLFVCFVFVVWVSFGVIC